MPKPNQVSWILTQCKAVETQTVKAKRSCEYYLSQLFPFADGESEAQEGKVNSLGPQSSMAKILLARASLSQPCYSALYPRVRGKLVKTLEKTKGKDFFPFPKLSLVT